MPNADDYKPTPDQPLIDGRPTDLDPSRSTADHASVL
jgi:hypothetical protein